MSGSALGWLPAYIDFTVHTVAVWGACVVSRAELLRAHRFARRRVVGAVESGRADGQPSRRGSAIASGMALALLALAAITVGRHLDRSPDWRRSDVVVVESDTGAQFVYVDRLLHPVPNYVSARLALGVPSAAVVTVSRSDLQGVSFGPMWGITGAPTSLPAAADLSDSWTVCSDESARPSLAFDTAVGGEPARYVIVGDRAGNSYLISDGRQTPYHGAARPRATVAPALLAAIPVAGDGSDAMPARAASPETAPGTLCAMRAGDAFSVVAHAHPPSARASQPGDRGALLRSGGLSGEVRLVVRGVAYPIRDADALRSLGLSGVVPMTVPAELLALMPQGAELSGDAARSPIDG